VLTWLQKAASEEELDSDDEGGTPRAGEDPSTRVPRPAPVNWEEPDIQVNGRWTLQSVASFVGAPADGVIYRALVPLSDLSETLVEEEDAEEGLTYDWSEMQSRRHPPPIVVVRGEGGGLKIADGNHRVRFWRENGYEYAPAWVYDELLTAEYRRTEAAARQP